jgi:quercetin dioxygenase-like cupin family protein
MIATLAAACACENATDPKQGCRETRSQSKTSPAGKNGGEFRIGRDFALLRGDHMSTHKHLEQDGIALVQTGMAHVQPGGQERDLHAGGVVFIPANTWVSLKVTGAERCNLVAIFSAPGFDDHCDAHPFHRTKKNSYDPGGLEKLRSRRTGRVQGLVGRE